MEEGEGNNYGKKWRDGMGIQEEGGLREYGTEEESSGKRGEGGGREERKRKKKEKLGGLRGRM